MSKLSIQQLYKHFGGTGAAAVQCVDLDVGEGELVSLLGPSGCGKTTTLRMVAGFLKPTSGRVLIGEMDVTGLPPYSRNTGMVFQSYALFPHLTVAQNVAFGLEMRGVPKADREARVREALRMVRLDAYLDRLPRQMSGGQQQRVALARALVVNPAVFLLDEPLSNLDAKLRAEVRMEIRELQQKFGLTTLMVTHDQEEALTMSDRLVVMEAGRVRQIGTAQDLYDKPADAFVAGFVGKCNVIEGTVDGSDVFRLKTGAVLPCSAGHIQRGEAFLAIRPENVSIVDPLDAPLRATVASIVYLGGQSEIVLDVNGMPLSALVPANQLAALHAGLERGSEVGVHWPASAARVLPA